MKIYSPNEIKNVAILGHSGCGKTTLVEAMLLNAGIIKRVGKIEDGNTVSDFDAEEIRRKVSISTSFIPVEWTNDKLNIMDTPGYFDFVGEVKQALRVADLAVIVVSARSGVEVGTEKAWEYATELNIPKLIFVNGMDDENADLDKVVEDLRKNFGKSIAPIQIPFKENGKFNGFVNVVKVEGRKYVNGKTENCDIPVGLADDIQLTRTMLMEAVAETSESLMEKFFAEEEFTIEEIQQGISDGILDGSVTPVICGSAVLNIGLQILLNSISRYVTSEKVCPKVTGIDPRTNEKVTRLCSPNEPFSAFVFKTIADPYVGRLNVFRVYSGTIKKDATIYNVKKDIVEKISHLYLIKGKEQIEVEELKTGDIGAIAKLQNTGTQDTLCTKEKPIILPEIAFGESLMTMAVVPKGKGDEDKISQALNKLLEEDRTLHFEVNKETHQSIIYGIGETHLDVLVHKLKNKYKIEVDLVPPIVPYREMIKSKVKIQGKYKKQSGGHGQYGDVWMEFEPSGDLTKAYIFEEKVFGGAVPRQYFPAVEKGIQECVKQGVLAAYPVVGLKATLVDGSYHPVDSSEMAFKMATTAAYKDGLLKAKPTILEPIAKVEVIVDDDYTGDVMGDMNKRRGRILGMNPFHEKQKIEVEVPLAEMFKYSTDLRSMTQGRGVFSLKFDRYDEAPADVQQKVIEVRKKLLEKEKEK